MKLSSARLTYRGNPTFCQPLESESSLVRFNGEDIQILVEATSDLPQFAVDGKLCTTPGTRDNVGQTSIICQSLGAGTHELDITNGQGVNMFVCLDSGATTLLLVAGTQSASQSHTPSASSSHPSATSAAYTGGTGIIAFPTPSGSFLPLSTTPRAAHTQQIVAGTVGGAIFVMTFAVCGYLLWLRRRRRYQGRQDTTLPGYVRPFVPSLRLSPPRSRSSSLEKASIETLNITEATGPTSAGSEVTVSPHDVVHAPLDHISASGPQSKRLSPVTNMGNMPSRRSAGTAAQSQPETIAGHTGSRAEEDLESTEATMGSAASALARSESHEIGRVLTSAPPEVQSGVMRILRSWLSQRAWQEPALTELDSGMRFVEDTYVPPPAYTTE